MREEKILKVSNFKRKKKNSLFADGKILHTENPELVKAVNSCNSLEAIQQSETGGTQVGVQPGELSETMCENKKGWG